MAKINVKSIAGYESMTAEEKLAALEAFDIPEPDYSGYVKKDVFDKASSQAAEYKRQLREKMDADEAAKAQADEVLEAMKTELEQLRADKAIGEHTAKFLELGYDQKLARETAEAMHKGDMATVFKNQAKFVADREKALRAEIMRDTPTPPAGNGDKEMSKEDFAKMTLAEKQKFAQDQPELFKKFYGG